ncbi:hypothetical protein [Streptomyces sp. NPDC091268]|uniref:hypothetical protein n=1 Tax=Streptomyces sp. NPDC091268 TaxID=3365979 RepID=UPI00382A0101
MSAVFRGPGPYADAGPGPEPGSGPGADCAFAAGCVEAAGRLLLDLLLEQDFGRTPGGERLVELGRTSSGMLLRNRIRGWDARDALLTPGTERGRARGRGPAELGRERVWIADPLDGVREFGEPGNPDWAVHLALWERGRGIVAAALVVPALCEAASTSDPAGAWRRSMRAPRRMRLLADTGGPAGPDGARPSGPGGHGPGGDGPGGLSPGGLGPGGDGPGGLSLGGLGPGGLSPGGRGSEGHGPGGGSGGRGPGARGSGGHNPDGHGPGELGPDGHGPGGLSSDGHGTGGLGPDGHGPGGLSSDGHGPGGLSPSGLGPGGRGSEGHGPAELGPDGHNPGTGSGGLSPGGHGPGGLAPDGHSSSGRGSGGLGPGGHGPGGLGPGGHGPGGHGPGGHGPGGHGPGGHGLGGRTSGGDGPGGLGHGGLPVGAAVMGVASEMGAEVAVAGAAGAKMLAVIRGEADAYVHDAGAWEWGSAALLAVAAAAGLHLTRIDGRPLRMADPTAGAAPVLICRPRLARLLLGAFARQAAAARAVNPFIGKRP